MRRGIPWAIAIIFTGLVVASILLRRSSEHPPESTASDPIEMPKSPEAPEAAKDLDVGSRPQETDISSAGQSRTIHSAEEAEALLVKAIRAGHHDEVRRLRNDPAMTRFMDHRRFSAIIAREAKEKLAEKVRYKGLEKTTIPTPELLRQLSEAGTTTSRETVKLIRQLRTADFTTQDLHVFKEFYESSPLAYRLALLRIMDTAGGTDVEPFLLEMARADNSARERVQALKTLKSRVPDDATLDSLVSLMRGEHPPKIRAAALRAISANKSERAAEITKDHLDHPTADLRAAAVRAVRFTDNTEATFSRIARTDEDPEVRRVAVSKLVTNRASDDRVDLLFGIARTDSDAIVRSEAIRTLASLRTPTATQIDHITITLQGLKDHDRSVHDEIVKALERLKIIRGISDRRESERPK